MRKPELLVPAGSLEVLKVAVTFGADAVYIGGKNYAIIRNPQTKPRRFGKPSGYVPPKPPQRPDENKEIK